MFENYRQTWRGSTEIEFTLDEVAEWANVNVKDVDRELVRKYVWESLEEIGFDEIEYLHGWG